MGYTIAEKIIKAHLLEGKMIRGEEIGIRIDQTLTQDATGTMAYLQLEAMGIERVKTELSVAYIDHNTLQCGFENADEQQCSGCRQQALHKKLPDCISSCHGRTSFPLPLYRQEKIKR